MNLKILLFCVAVAMMVIAAAENPVADILEPKDAEPEERRNWRNQGQRQLRKSKGGRKWKKHQLQKKNRLLGDTFKTKKECEGASFKAEDVLTKDFIGYLLAAVLRSKRFEKERASIPEEQTCAQLCKCLTKSTSSACRKVGWRKHRCSCGLPFIPKSFFQRLDEAENFCGEPMEPKEEGSHEKEPEEKEPKEEGSEEKEPEKQGPEEQGPEESESGESEEEGSEEEGSEEEGSEEEGSEEEGPEEQGPQELEPEELVPEEQGPE